MPKITKVYAFVADESGNGDEGFCAVHNGDWGWVPLVFADPAKADALKVAVQRIADQTGKEIRLCTFVGRENLETIRPRGDSPPEPAKES